MTQKAIKTELLLLDRGGGRGGDREVEERDLEGEREAEREVRNWEIGTDEKRNFKTATYIIPLIKDPDAFILRELFLECLCA